MPEEHIRPRTAFKHFIDYLHAEMIDFEKLEADGMMETYYKAMQFVSEQAGNLSYNPFYKKDGLLLLAIQSEVKSIFELSDSEGVSIKSIAPSMNKLINLGYVSSFKENKITYYRITPYGLKYLEDLIGNPDSVLYDND